MCLPPQMHEIITKGVYACHWTCSQSSCHHVQIHICHRALSLGEGGGGRALCFRPLPRVPVFLAFIPWAWIQHPIVIQCFHFPLPKPMLPTIRQLRVTESISKFDVWVSSTHRATTKQLSMSTTSSKFGDTASGRLPAWRPGAAQAYIPSTHHPTLVFLSMCASIFCSGGMPASMIMDMLQLALYEI